MLIGARFEASLIHIRLECERWLFQIDAWLFYCREDGEYLKARCQIRLQQARKDCCGHDQRHSMHFYQEVSRRYV